MSKVPISLTEKAHGKYRLGEFKEALALYDQALEVATVKQQKIALHSNRAACFLKLRQLPQVVEACSKVLEIDAKHANILLLRSQSLEAMGDLDAALRDVAVLLPTSPTQPNYVALQSRLLAKLEAQQSEMEACERHQANEEAGDEASQPAAESGPVALRESTGGTSRSSNEAARRETMAEEVSMAVSRGQPSDSLVRQPADKQPLAGKENSGGGPSGRETGRSGAKENAWAGIPKPKGHSMVDYQRWETIGDDLSDEEGAKAAEEATTFRVRNLKILPVAKVGK